MQHRLLFVVSFLPWEVNAKGFLKDNVHLNANALGNDLQRAMDEVLGCGGRFTTTESFPKIKQAVVPMWQTMPKNTHGRLDWKSLRYVAHRYFMQKSSLLIRGLEPTRLLNTTDPSSAEIINQQVPALVDALLGGRHASLGYTMDDVVSLLAALEQLIFDSESELIQRIYEKQLLQTNREISWRDFSSLLETYTVHWLVGDDLESLEMLLENRSLLDQTVPHWQQLKGFLDGRIEAMDYTRAQKFSAKHGGSIMNRRYSFDDVHEVVGGITQSFQSYWESECVAMKSRLVQMDADADGRVRLSDFYGGGIDGDLWFGESEAYLRDLGVLDETSTIRGKQVIIPNYLQAASNCIVAAPYYLVCCTNECETMLGEIEHAVGAPMSTPDEILRVVKNLSSPSADYDESPKLDSGLQDQLWRVAEPHGGRVPIHGRLFAQWLHYVFPRECPFPHKAGTFAAHTLTPSAFGDEFMATTEEMTKHATATFPTNNVTQTEEIDALWSSEEEFFADYSGHLQSPWERRSVHWMLACIIFVVFLGIAGGMSRGKGISTTLGSTRQTCAWTSGSTLGRVPLQRRCCS